MSVDCNRNQLKHQLGKQLKWGNCFLVIVMSILHNQVHRSKYCNNKSVDKVRSAHLKIPIKVRKALDNVLVPMIRRILQNSIFMTPRILKDKLQSLV